MISERGRWRFEPLSDSWFVVVLDVLAVCSLSSVSLALASAVEQPVLRWGLFLGATFVFVLTLVAMPLRATLRAHAAQASASHEELKAQTIRQDFEARVSRGLELADNEGEALRVAGRALAMCAPSAAASVLVADSSDAHLQTIVSSGDHAPFAVCDVATPRGCPAVRLGHTLEFGSSEQLDCCAHLTDRDATGLAAVCVPISVVGRSTGVVHAVRRGGAFDIEERRRFESVAMQVGQRVGMLRATATAQLQASTDPLTGLYNRRSMEEAVRPLVHDGVPYAVCVCDLDHFKKLNDTYGHDTGDRALRIFALTLRNTVRSGDLVSRHGGEEFVVVAPYADAEAAARILDRLRLELLAVVGDGRTPSFTMSAGVADTTESTDYHTLLSIADARLLQAKRSGRDRVLSGIH
jgi:diguanylate cyclase (GGDEF)-like protein